MPTTYAIPDGRVAMAATTYTGTGSNPRTFTGLGFQPDLIWNKSRSNAGFGALWDSVRGGTKTLQTYSVSDEATIGTAGGSITSFNSDGATFANGSINDSWFNTSAVTYVSWQWKAGGAAVTNTAGSITSQVSANTTAGFSIVTYTGTGANATVGHGLGVAPKMIITKPRNSADNWISWHTALGATGYIYLNLTNASATGAEVWNSTLPTSTVFSLGTSSNANSNGQTQVAYCWAAVPGYSAFGSYTGNGSNDGPFVYTSFQPRFVMIKLASAAGGNWIMVDTSRDTYNLSTNKLGANVADAENGVNVGNSTQNTLDILSNGFKLRATQTDTNGNGNTYIYACFASNPFKFSNAR